MGANDSEKKSKRAFLNSLMFVLGSTLIFVLLAILASSFGEWIAENMLYFKITFAIILLFFGLDYMELIHIKIPNISPSLRFDTNNLSLSKSFVFGILFTITHSPCTGIFLATALSLVINEKSIVSGIILMILYSLGLGVPFILSAILIEKAKKVFGFIKKHYKIIKAISGIKLIISAIY